ncbi:MAG TPA: 5-formyltetrahydrofolate cyclo-ligase [Acidiferrobacteraceae bacterium]|nr:5-formyltetrahydrofolate cyclo-ligase [Acidiferrobacteraceae bacterium]
MKSKANLRKTLRQRRHILSDAEQDEAAQKLAVQINKHPLFRRSRHVAIYYPNDGEIDPSIILNMAWRQKKYCYLPILWPLGENQLRFAPITPKSRLALNRFDIPEPTTTSRKIKSARHLDLILLPLVAADRHGNRLGMGGGFYDKSLAFLHRRRSWKQPHIIGIAYDFQIVDNLPSDPWDVQLDALITDTNSFNCIPG